MSKKTPKWLKDRAMLILKNLGYDISQDVSKQFEERHKEKLSEPLKKISRQRKKS